MSLTRFTLGSDTLGGAGTGGAGVVSEAMPTRKYSSLVLTGSWPATSSQTEQANADAAGKAAEQAEHAAASVRNTAERFIAETGGRFAGAQYEGYMRDYQLGMDHAGFLRALEDARSELSNEVHSVKGRLDQIDWEANDKLEQLESAGTLASAIKLEIIGAARAMAMADATATAAKIGTITAKIAAKVPPPPRPGGGGDKPGIGGGVQHSPKIDRPGEVSPMGNEHGKGESEGRGDSGGQPGRDGDAGPDKAGQTKTPDDTALKNQPGATSPARGEGQTGQTATPKQPSIGNAAGANPFSGGGSSGGGQGGGLGSGLMGGAQNPSSALQSGLKGMGSPGGGSSPGGLGSGLGHGASSASPGSGAGSSAGGVNPMRDFARGFSQGAATAPPPLAQQVAPPPAQPTTGTTNSVAPPPQAAPAASPVQGAAAGPAMTPVAGPAPSAAPPTAAPGAGGAGLPPVGSDLVKHTGAGGAGPAVASSAQATSATPPAASSVAGGAATASMAAMAGSRSKSSPNSAGELPVDPLLADAVRLTYQLMHGSRFFAGIDWCVGVFRSDSGAVETVVTSNEGSSYVPAGVFLPRSARLLFADSLVDKAFRDQWFGFSEPVATMMAYAGLRPDSAGKLSLYAVAASSMMGGALSAAEVAGVQHVHLCYPADSPFSVADGDQVLDDLHVHRLAAVDAEAAAWFAGEERTIGEVTARCAELTTAAWSAVSARLGQGEMLVPDVGAAVYNTLQFGDVVDDKRWDHLWESMCEAQWSAAALRPDADSAVTAELYRARHDIARLMELLYWWRPSPDGDGGEESVRFTEIAYCAGQIEGVE